MFKVYDDCETFGKIYLHIKFKLIPKAEGNPKKLELVTKLQKQFLELYERAKTKEKDIKEAAGESYNQSFYRIGIPHKGHRNIFDGLRFR